MTRRIGRPCGTIGPIAQAMLQAAAQPGTVVELARRAQVGRASAHYTVTRLLQAGMLEVVAPRTRPAVLRLREAREAGGLDVLLGAMAAWR